MTMFAFAFAEARIQSDCQLEVNSELPSSASAAAGRQEQRLHWGEAVVWKS